MQADKQSTDRVGVHSIMQIAPDAGIAFGNGQLAVVSEKLTWGVVASIWTATGWALVRLAWQHIEPTGGMEVWDAEGKQVLDTYQPLAHHP